MSCLKVRDLQAPEESTTPPGGRLRRSSRQSKKLFNAASIEQDDSLGSDGEESSPSMDGYNDAPYRKSKVHVFWVSITFHL